MFSSVTKGGGSSLKVAWGGGGLTYRPRGSYYYSKLNCYSMPAQTRGGIWRSEGWTGERVFSTPLGVKIRRVNGCYQYNPPSLKFSCVRVLDYNFRDPRNPRLYTAVQACVDKLVDMVEEHLVGVQWEGISNRSRLAIF